MNPAALTSQIKAFLARYSLQQKLGMVFSAGLVVALMWSMVYYVNRVEYQVLYSDLDPQEAQSIVTKLQAMQAKYELSNDGTTIRVSSDKLSEVRIQLASEGLPESGRVGFEIFDRTNFGLTNFQEQVNYQRALEGELARSIMTLNEVAAARVHLVMARESLYQNSEDQTKASVILKLKNGRNLPASAVQGIINVVASAVKGLSPEKISVIDYKGKILSRSDGEHSLTGQQLDVRQKIESEMAAKIVQILEPTVGAGKVRPQVSIAMNFQQVEETVEHYDPQGSVIKSTQRETENAPNSRSVGGVVGPRSVNPAAVVPGAVPVAEVPATPAGPLPLKQNEVINYEVSKSVKHIVNEIGKVDRVSVAVIVDNQTTTTTTPEGQTETKSTPRSEADMKKYKDLVSAAIAFNTERGDQLIVENVSFESELETITEPTFLEKQAPQILTGLRYLIIPFVFILIYFLFIRPVQKTVFSAAWQPAEALSGRSASGGALPRNGGGVQTPMTVRQLEARLQNGGATPEQDEYANTAERELLPLPQQSRMDLIRKRVVEHAQADPETVARLVRVWLNDEKNK
jgi:flagellar M-ring protein FliF